MSSLPRIASDRAANERSESPTASSPPQVSRILFVAAELRNDTVGNSVLRLGRELRRRGKEAGLLCGGCELLDGFEGIGISPTVSRFLRGPGDPLLLPRSVVAQVRGFNPDLIQLFGRSLGRWGLRLSRATDCPYVLTIMTFASSARVGRIRGDWRRGSILVASEELREELVNQGRIPKGVIGVVPIGIALEDYERYRDTDGPGRVPVVGTVGPLTPDRGYDYFLRAAKEILDRGHEAQFLIAGNGPEQDHLRRLIRKLNIEQWVTMVHHFADYRRMIAVLDICVVSPVREGLGLNVIEAMACHKPVVATGVGAVYDVVKDGETGFLAPKQNPGAIAEKVIRLLEDRDLARRVAGAAYEMVRERFSLQASVRSLLDFYAKCVARWEGA